MKKKHYKILGGLLLSLFLIVWACNYRIDSATEGKTYSELSELPKNRVGIVLGTSSKLAKGGANPYYTYRINAAVKLYRAGKIEFILVSGDNSTHYYNEPKTIKKDLIKEGIPAEKIFLDYAGFRTLDSMVRAKEVFGLQRVTVISQKFHNERAIYLAEKKGLMAVGFNARDVSARNGAKVQFREYFARVKVFLDLLFNTQPKFYGDKVEIK
ncbi:vancomycin high temperature exclusion protein [Aggregatimonas sangjinii]|uniref:Vancomycin high temperature exclusion protein n=1 Tax=Aggregatimonas sangjinii TaxID=2583587 RepID=A0A5B7SRH1_9FLAO|nr:ElyC/SanA/YdcF family protein [Aggregatimonas sangjinii]QCX01167.1 vancomycin high temperature exclusion protein [Aggregatimonas sangjinii]